MRASTLSLFELERRHILEVLKAAGGNRTQAAALLGITVRTLRNKLKLYQTL
ncbi:MAG: helix-turn-helix domain-containing protein [Bdellovibrionota bacterium]